jgi:hypothetical protein
MYVYLLCAKCAVASVFCFILVLCVQLSELQTCQRNTMTFKEAFENKKDVLTKTLKVTDDLLCELTRARLLKEEEYKYYGSVRDCLIDSNVAMTLCWLTSVKS